VSASGALGSGNVTIQGGNQNTWVSGFSGTPTAFVFAGNTSHSNNFTLSGNATISASNPDGATASGETVTLSGNVSLDNNTLFVRGRGTGTISGQISGTGGITKIDNPGTWILTGTNTYTGTTTVAAGVLRIEKTGLNAIVDSAANTLVAEFTSPPAAGAYPILPGPLAGAQTFTATGLGVNQEATFLNATSTVTVTNTVTDPFVTWIDGYAPDALLPDDASKLPGADPDGDGITNLMEFVLGGSPVVSSQSIQPTLATVGSDLVLSYTRSDESESVTTQVGQWSTDLSSWTNITPVLINENDASADDMSITVPNSNAVNGKMFLRLSVESPTP
jgi:autotransporter-associated beta strand protein